MPKRSSKKPSDDPNVAARDAVRRLTGQDDDEQPAEQESPPEPEKNPHAVALGRQGGLKGGKARAAKLAAEERREIARRAAAARWEKRNQ